MPEKPKNTEVKHVNGHWHLYKRTTSYNPATRKSKKVSGKLLGKLTPEGFDPSKITMLR